jgi:hypothetical protein
MVWVFYEVIWVVYEVFWVVVRTCIAPAVPPIHTSRTTGVALSSRSRRR